MRIGLTANELVENFGLWCWGKEIPTDVDKLKELFKLWLSQFKPIATITIPRYIRTFKTSEAIREKYYEKGTGKKIPFQYLDKHLWKTQKIREPDNINYFWHDFPVVRQKVKKMVSFLVDKDGNKVVANAKHVGKPRIENINGQDLYNGYISKVARNKMMLAIKEQMRNFAMSHPEIKTFPILMEVEVWDTPIDKVFSSGQDWDLGNRIFPYNKAFEDVLKDKDCSIIPDDSIWYLTGPPAPIFCPIDNTENRKLVYKIYLDTRSIIRDNPLYKDKFNL